MALIVQYFLSSSLVSEPSIDASFHFSNGEADNASDIALGLSIINDSLFRK